MDSDGRSVTAILIEVRRTFDYRGRSRGKDGLIYSLFTTAIALTQVIAEIFHGWRLPELLDVLVALALTAPFIAWSVRRLHDADRTGLWALLWLVLPVIPVADSIVAPVVAIALVLLFLIPASEGSNRFGPNPCVAFAD